MRSKYNGACFIAVLALGLLFSARTCLAQSRHPPRSNAGDSLEIQRFLRDYLKDTAAREDTTTRYSAALVDLKDDGSQEAIVYVTGRTWCGSGGCRMLVIAPSGSSYSVIAETTITRLPIRELATKSNGWHDIGVWVEGGGIHPGYEAKLSFDGHTYPRNPSVPPSLPIRGTPVGEVVLPKAAEAMPLY